MRGKRRAALALVMLLALGSGVAPAGAGPPPPQFDTLFVKYPVTVNGSYIPLVGATLDCVDSGFAILWYAPGRAPDSLWGDFAPGSGGNLVHSNVPLSINGTYEPFVGDFDGNHCDDVFWYAPGPAPDYVWYANLDGSFTSKPVTVNGSYTPIVSDYNGAVEDDIFWYADGGGTESIWQGTGSRTFTKSTSPQVVTNGYQAGAMANGLMYFYRPGSGNDYLWADIEAGATAPGVSVLLDPINLAYEAHPVSGNLLMYGPGSAPDKLLGDFQEDGSFQQLGGTIGGPFRVATLAELGFGAIVLHAPGSAPDSIWIDD